MNGEDLRVLLEKDPNAQPWKQDNNEYLVSYRFDTGAEVAFDPRTIIKCSVFIENMPERMRKLFPNIDKYPPKQPSTALQRVSDQLSAAKQIYKVD